MPRGPRRVDEFAAGLKVNIDLGLIRVQTRAFQICNTRNEQGLRYCCVQRTVEHGVLFEVVPQLFGRVDHVLDAQRLQLVAVLGCQGFQKRITHRARCSALVQYLSFCRQ